jgi:ferredoxin
MLANYGYEDGSGHYYIKIDTSKCAECGSKDCIESCPEKLFVIELDDFDDEVVVIREDARHILQGACSICKSGAGEACLKHCNPGALSFSW